MAQLPVDELLKKSNEIMASLHRCIRMKGTPTVSKRTGKDRYDEIECVTVGETFQN